jgi:anhydro-N-acetylmuramic acid kinase
VPELYIGLMSGTSLDGIDGVLVDFSGSSSTVRQHVYAPFASDLRQEFLALNTTGGDELHRAALAGNALARAYARVVSDLLAKAGITPADVVAIGAHGQTVRHRPQEFDVASGVGVSGAWSGGAGYTLQLNNPALLAELAGIDVVADFRSRDVAAGGQGAPLVPAFHQAVFGRADEGVAVLNVGGISNVTLLGPLATKAPDGGASEEVGAGAGVGVVIGFDCGPGNALMDHWCQQHTGQAFDSGGQWAASGQVETDLLKAMLDEPFFAKPPPKSTGRDLFNVPWLVGKLTRFTHLNPVHVQTTLTELTASACVSSITSYDINSKTLIVCGGGALNTYLMTRLQAGLAGMTVASSQAHGLPPLQVEAAAFAWLARKAIRRETGSLPKVTGTRGARILGAIYPA